jgi:O-antigen/teichoic acid export membrane protein
MILKMSGEIILVISSIMLGYGLYGAVLSFLFIRIIIFFSLLIYIFKKIGIKFPDFSLIKNYLNFGLPNVFSSLSYWVVIASDRYFIGFFLGIIFVGYYVPAYSIGTILGFFLFPLSSILSIVLPKLFDENNMNEVKKYLSYSLKYYLLIIIPSVFGLSVLSRKLLVIFSTQEIASHSYLITPFIAVSILLYGISYFFSQILVLEKKTKTIAIIWMVAAIFNLGLNIVFIPRSGIIAAAVTTLVSYFFSFSIMWYLSSKEFQFKIDWKFIFKSILSSIVMSLFVIWFNPAGLLKIIIAIALSVGIYVILILLLNGIKKKEIEFFKNLLTNAYLIKSKI